MITKKQLEEIGFVETMNYVFPMEKELGKTEDGDKLSIVISSMRNSLELAIVMPTGDLLYINGAKTVEDIQKIESFITEFKHNN